MNFPYRLLRMLPMWDYICPRCKGQVERSSHKCPYCGERFGVPLRVPPKMLKEHDLLEKYVHEKVFPRISEFERNYLTQFFTVFFADGFETGDLTKWTAQFLSTGTFAASQDVAHSGKWSGKASNIQAASTYAYTEKTLAAAQASIYLRYYMRFATLLNANANRWVGGVASSISSWAGIPLRNESTSKWGMLNNAPALGPYMESGTTIVSANTWYCLELYDVINAATGSLTLWVDGVMKVNQTGLNTATGGNNIDEVAVGLECRAGDAGEAASRTVYFDDVVASDAYNGLLRRASGDGLTWAQ